MVCLIEKDPHQTQALALCFCAAFVVENTLTKAQNFMWMCFEAHVNSQLL